MTMDRWTNLLTLLAAMIAIVTILLIGAPQQAQWWRSAIGPAAWALSPYAVMWLLNNVIVAEQRQRDMVLLATISAMLLLECAHIGLIVSGHDDTSLASRLQQLPLLQLLVAVTGGAIAYLLPVVSHRHQAD